MTLPDYRPDGRGIITVSVIRGGLKMGRDSSLIALERKRNFFFLIFGLNINVCTESNYRGRGGKPSGADVGGVTVLICLLSRPLSAASF